MANRGHTRLIVWDDTGGDGINGNDKRGSDDGNTKTKDGKKINGTTGPYRTLSKHRTYNEGTLKALDQVIEERGILKPQSKSKSSQGSSDQLSLDKNGRNQWDRPYSSKFIPRISLNDIIGNFGNTKYSNAVSANDSNRRGEDVVDGRAGQQTKISEAEATLTISKKGKLDPRSCSLEDIIVDRCGSDEGSKSPKQNDDVGSTQKYILTPYQTVFFLQEMGMIIDLKMGTRVPQSTEDEDPIRNFRCIVQCGAVQGISDSSDKVVSREVACVSFLKNLQKIYPDGKIPHYEVPNEVLLDPKVFEEISKLCKHANISIWHEFENPRNKTNNIQGALTEFTYVYYIRDRKLVGKSTSKKYAQLKAAYKAYEFFRREDFQKIVYFTDDQCDLYVKYDFTDTGKDEQFADLDSPELKQLFAQVWKEILEGNEGLESAKQ